MSFLEKYISIMQVANSHKLEISLVTLIVCAAVFGLRAICKKSETKESTTLCLVAGCLISTVICSILIFM